MLHLLRSKIMVWRWAPDKQAATFLVPLFCDSRLQAVASSALESSKRVRRFRPPIAAWAGGELFGRQGPPRQKSKSPAVPNKRCYLPIADQKREPASLVP